MRQRNRRFLYQTLQGKACVDCGEKRWEVLEFDHVRGKKLFGISTAISSSRSIASIQKEMDKCEIRCANCHRLKTMKQFGHYKADWDNTADLTFEVPTYKRKKTSYLGVRRHNTKLTEKKVLAIRAEYKPWKMSRAMLARKYKVSEGSIQKILERKSWAHI